MRERPNANSLTRLGRLRARSGYIGPRPSLGLLGKAPERRGSRSLHDPPWEFQCSSTIFRSLWAPFSGAAKNMKIRTLPNVFRNKKKQGSLPPGLDFHGLLMQFLSCSPRILNSVLTLRILHFGVLKKSLVCGTALRTFFSLLVDPLSNM